LAALGGVARSHKFFRERPIIEVDFGDDGGGQKASGGTSFLDYKGVPRNIGIALSFEQPRVTLYELQTIYGVEDLHKILEVGLVNAHNARVIAKQQQEAMRRMRSQG